MGNACPTHNHSYCSDSHECPCSVQFLLTPVGCFSSPWTWTEPHKVWSHSSLSTRTSAFRSDFHTVISPLSTPTFQDSPGGWNQTPCAPVRHSTAELGSQPKWASLLQSIQSTFLIFGLLFANDLILNGSMCSAVLCFKNMCGIKLGESELCADSKDLPSEQWTAHDEGVCVWDKGLWWEGLVGS